MTDLTSVPCQQGGKKHRVEERVLDEAKGKTEADGSFTVFCMDCGKPITKGPTDLTFRGTVE